MLIEYFGIASAKPTAVLTQKEQNCLSELIKLAIINREEKYIFEISDDEEI